MAVSKAFSGEVETGSRKEKRAERSAGGQKEESAETAPLGEDMGWPASETAAL
jgi:hypothetical protein